MGAGRPGDKGPGTGRPSDAELRAKLTPQQYQVTCEQGTEPPFRNAYWDEHRPGLYVDLISGEPLFSSRDKFDSGTGWPSFTRPLAQTAVVQRRDSGHGLERVEVRSASSDAHLGHLFDDGPAPTGQRFCMNSASLRFIPLAELEREGYGAYRAQVTGEAPHAGPQGANEATSGQAAPQQALFAAGCFWGIESAFARVPGVLQTEVGYTGGTTEQPSYEEVCSDRTGHAEAVRVVFDPTRVSYDELLAVFWKIHDPTTLDRQGPDVGSQYRSAIFFAGPEQEARARRSLEAEGARRKRPIVTQIVPAGTFWRAEEYHQKYHDKHGGSCFSPAG